jgi:predicted nuclease of predicted toxin-antitoxin system
LTRFLLDENVPRSLGEALKKRGYVIRSTTEAQGPGLRNSDLVNIAKQTKEIILTFDSDFLSLGSDLQGLARVVYIEMHPRNPRKAPTILEKWIDEYLELLKRGNTVRLTEIGPVLQTQPR